MTYTYDTLGRRTGVSLMNGSSAVQNTSYTYDNLSRLATVGNGTLAATYTRDPGRNRLASTSIANSAGEIMNVTRQYDAYDRLTSIGSTAGTTTRSYNYTYNDRDQRINCTLADGTCWEYAYDDKGQVTGGVRKDAQGKSIPGQSFGYGYDEIGNRLTETRGIAENLISYTANNLNQYTQRRVNGIVPVAGEADPDAVVTIIRDGEATSPAIKVTATRDGKYFKGALPVDNRNGDKTVSYSIFAVKEDPANNKQLVRKETRTLLVPRADQPFTYDDDGNLLTDGKWTYAWDGENRLISAISAATKLEFAYDYQSRRISKKVYTGTAGNWTLSKTEKYAYDGWNCIALFDAANVLQKFYLWGEDLSGSLQGAGGVGGLLAETNSNGSYIPAYDGNGNIMVYVNAADKTIVAEYTYDPFGRTLTASGDLKGAFTYRFSTKPLDAEVGLYYYGYRYYSPEQGRWLSRDPIEEAGGTLLYGFVGNSPIRNFDVLGQEWDPKKPSTWTLPKGVWLDDTPGNGRFLPAFGSQSATLGILEYKNGVPLLSKHPDALIGGQIHIVILEEGEWSGTQSDSKKAASKLKTELPKGEYNWHHEEIVEINGKKGVKMVLVPKKLNRGIFHSGPASWKRAVLNMTPKSKGILVKGGLSCLKVIGIAFVLISP